MLNAIEFYKQFQDSVVENRIHKDGRTFLEIYKTDEPAFTELVNKTLIKTIIENSGLTAQHEYFRIDTVGWNGRYEALDAKESKQIGLNRHLWDLEIAVEHENNKADWLDELIKLIHIRCPLKVVIGYNYCDQREEAEKKKLIYAAKCMQMVKAFHTPDQEEYLILLGNGAPKDKRHETYSCFNYRAYLYDYQYKGFKRLK